MNDQTIEYINDTFIRQQNTAIQQTIINEDDSKNCCHIWWSYNCCLDNLLFIRLAMEKIEKKYIICYEDGRKIIVSAENLEIALERFKELRIEKCCQGNQKA